jgi:hypothetical protein
MLLRYEILKLQWELNSIIKNSDSVRNAKNVAHENGDWNKYLTFKVDYFKAIK